MSLREVPVRKQSVPTAVVGNAARALCERGWDGALVHRSEPADRERQRAGDLEGVTADLADRYGSLEGLDRLPRTRDDDPAGPLSEERGAFHPGQLHPRAQSARDAALRERAGETALRDVVNTDETALAHRAADRRERVGLRGQVDRRQPPREAAAQLLELR